MRKTITTLVFLVIVMIGLGFYLHWFDLSTASDAQQDKININLNIDKGKIKADAETAKEKSGELAQRLEKKADDISAKDQTAQGKVAAVDDKESSFTLTDKRKELTIHLDATNAKIRLRGAEAHLKDLRTGDEVSVVYRVTDGKNIARSVTINRQS